MYLRGKIISSVCSVLLVVLSKIIDGSLLIVLSAAITTVLASPQFVFKKSLV